MVQNKRIPGFSVKFVVHVLITTVVARKMHIREESSRIEISTFFNFFLGREGVNSWLILEFPSSKIKLDLFKARVTRAID